MGDKCRYIYYPLSVLEIVEQNNWETNVYASVQRVKMVLWIIDKFAKTSEKIASVVVKIATSPEKIVELLRRLSIEVGP